jgi:hypothetical protein
MQQLCAGAATKQSASCTASCCATKHHTLRKQLVANSRQHTTASTSSVKQVYRSWQTGTAFCVQTNSSPNIHRPQLPAIPNRTSITSTRLGSYTAKQLTRSSCCLPTLPYLLCCPLQQTTPQNLPLLLETPSPQRSARLSPSLILSTAQLAAAPGHQPQQQQQRCHLPQPYAAGHPASVSYKVGATDKTASTCSRLLVQPSSQQTDRKNLHPPAQPLPQAASLLRHH